MLPGLSEPERSIYQPREMKSGAAWLCSATQTDIDGFLDGLSENALMALPWVFEFWALPHQLPPEGAWRTWVIMGGRGAGKTRAGAEWVRSQVEGAGPLDAGRCKRLGKQELEGLLIEDMEGALWTHEILERCRADGLPEFNRVVVAVDPPVSGKSSSDECGILVVGAVTEGPPQNWRAYVIEDATVQGVSPDGWARAALAAMARHKGDRLVAEVNQGGDMVRSVIRNIDALAPIRTVHASHSKQVRAEPVAALYEQGRVFHVRGLAALEDQMCKMTTQGFMGKGSPDLVDALVWALTDLIVEPGTRYVAPQVRTLR